MSAADSPATNGGTRRPSVVPGIWFTDPRDGLTHLWQIRGTATQWTALCGLTADPATLLDPEDDFGRHLACDIALGHELAERQDEVRRRQLEDVQRAG